MMQNNKFPKIALTGGYASGKSTVAKIFSKYGYLTYSADEIYNQLVQNKEFALKMYDLIGIKQISDFSEFDRKLVADVVFSDSKKLHIINEFSHRAVYEEIDKLYNSNNDKKIIFEIPLLFESGRENDFDIIIIVMRNLGDRIKFGAKRDKINEEQSALRIKNQINYDNIEKLEHTFIYNNGDLNALELEVKKVIDQISLKFS